MSNFTSLIIKKVKLTDQDLLHLHLNDFGLDEEFFEKNRIIDKQIEIKEDYIYFIATVQKLPTQQEVWFR